MSEPELDAAISDDAIASDSIGNRWGLPFAIGFVGVVLSLIVAQSILDGVRRTRAAEIESRMVDLVARVQTEVNIHLSAVRSLRAHFAASREVTENEFTSFASIQLSDEIGTIAYGWAPRVQRDERESFEKAQRAVGFPDFTIREYGPVGSIVKAQQKQEYYPAKFLAPFEAARSLLGVDLSSIAGMAKPITDSIDFDEVMLASPMVEGRSILGGHVGVAVYPIYPPGIRSFLVDQRRKNVEGVVFGAFNLRNIFAYAVQNSSIGELLERDAVALNVLTVQDANNMQTLFETGGFEAFAAAENFFNPLIHSEHAFSIGTLPVNIEVAADIDAVGSNNLVLPVSVMLIGMILTGTLCALTFTLQGRERRVAALVVERTKELEYSQQRLNDMADVAADWFWELDDQLRFTFLSSRFAEITGFNASMFLGRTRAEVILSAGQVLDNHWKQHFEDLEARRPFRDFRYKLNVVDDWFRYFSISGKPTFAADGTFLGYRGSGRDVTEEEISKKQLRDSEKTLHRYIEELEVSRQYLEENTAEMAELAEQHAIEKERAEASERSKSEFLASMSHEIRTPMTGVMGFADMLLDSKLEPDDREKVIKIKAATQSLLTIINDILDLSKLEAARLEIEYLDFNLKLAIEEAVDLVRERAKVKGLALSVEYDEELAEGINGDPTRVRQILINLIGNAVKFTHEGGITVKAGFTGDAAARKVRIAVIDTGIGIAEENRRRLFTDFTQADASISRKYEGTGLGLAISKRLVELMGGEIGVKSVEGEGSEFWFDLPYVPATTDVSREMRHLQPTDFKATRPLNILVAEDNKLNQRIVAATMDKYGHRTTIVENGEQAVAALNGDAYDLILMDVRMPGMSGPEATRVIRESKGPSSNIPIIALTADAMEEHVRGFMAVGMNACVTKPIDRAQLLTAINEVLDEEVHVPDESTDEPPAVDSKPEMREKGAEGGNLSLAAFLEDLDGIAEELEKTRGAKS